MMRKSILTCKAWLFDRALYASQAGRQANEYHTWPRNLPRMTNPKIKNLPEASYSYLIAPRSYSYLRYDDFAG